MANGSVGLATPDGDDYGKIGAGEAEIYANQPPKRLPEGFTLGPYGLVEDPGASERQIINVSRAPVLGMSAIAGLRRSQLRPETGHIALTYPVPKADSHGGYTIGSGTPDLDPGKMGTSGQSGGEPLGYPSI